MTDNTEYTVPYWGDPRYGASDFPDKVRLFKAAQTWRLYREEALYVKRIYCYADIIMLDEDGVIGECTCSNCHSLMDPFAKFCSNCGAKSKGRRIVNDGRDEQVDDDSES